MRVSPMIALRHAMSLVSLALLIGGGCASGRRTLPTAHHDADALRQLTLATVNESHLLSCPTPHLKSGADVRVRAFGDATAAAWTEHYGCASVTGGALVLFVASGVERVVVSSRDAEATVDIDWTFAGPRCRAGARGGRP